jgi:PilZ domain
MREMGDEPIERRKALRETGPFAAVARLYSGHSIACIVLNLSESGAKLALAKGHVLPKEFELSIPARNASWRVRVVWQDGRQLGVFRV